jgi:hypothetical protein
MKITKCPAETHQRIVNGFSKIGYGEEQAHKAESLVIAFALATLVLVLNALQR